MMQRHFSGLLLATAIALPVLALAGIYPPPAGSGGGGMDTNADNAVLPTARLNLGLSSAAYSTVHGADYGMVCDGATDTTTAAQNTANAAAGKAIIQWPAGRCIVSATIAIPDGVAAVQGTGAQSEGQVLPANWAGTTFTDTRGTGDVFTFAGKKAPVFRDFAIYETTYKTAGAGIAINGYNTTLTGTVSSGATSLPVVSSTGFLNGDPVRVLRSDGTLYAGTVNGAPGATSIPVTPAYSGANASNGANVWDMPAQKPRFSNLFILGTWDGIRLDNATGEYLVAVVIQDYGNDGLKKINQAAPDSGNAWYGGNQFVDQSRGTSNAGVEWLSGGDAAFIGNKFFQGNYNFLLNATYNATASLRLLGNSLESAKTCAVQASQGASGVVYNMFKVDENEFSMGTVTNSQAFCIATGSAANWLSKVSFANNVVASAATNAQAMVDVEAGDQVKIQSNQFDNSNAANSATAIKVAAAATNAEVLLNRITNYATNYNLANGLMAFDTGLGNQLIMGGAAGAWGTGDTGTLGITQNIASGGLSASIVNSAADGTARAGWQMKTGNSANIWQAFVRAGKMFIGVPGGGDNVSFTQGGGMNFIGSTSGTVTVKAAAVAGSNTLTLPAGTTDFSATGGVSNFLRQNSAGGAITVVQPATSDLSDIATFNLATSGSIAGKVKTSTKTGNYAVVAGDTGTYFDNTAASGEVDFTLPAYAAGLRYCFTVTAAQTLKVIAPASNKIAIGATNSAAAGNITASAVYAASCIHATTVSNQWAAEDTTGTWTVN